MRIRRERAEDVAVIRAVTAAAFARPDQPVPPEAPLVDALRATDDWLPALSLVATDADDTVIGHVVATRAHVADAPVLGLGPLSVRPDRQRDGVGSALVHTLLGAADALGEPLVALLGDPNYYRRFGFVRSDGFGIVPPITDWQPHFQVRPLTAHRPDLTGAFRYSPPFDAV